MGLLSSKLKFLSYTYHSRRATDKCPVNDAVADYLLFAFEKLDSVDSIPPTHCKACNLLHLSSLHLSDASSVPQDTCCFVGKPY